MAMAVTVGSAVVEGCAVDKGLWCWWWWWCGVGGAID